MACALSMEQRSNDAALKDALTRRRKEECATGTGQRPNDAAAMDVQINQGKEECASDMEQRSNDAAAKDAQMYLSKEECAKGMGQFQLSMSNYTTAKAQTKFREEGYVGDTGRIASHTMNLQRLGQNSRRLPQLKPHPISCS
eukprot:scaffold7624_cov110-Skeletonema_marinoi.AAC.3